MLQLRFCKLKRSSSRPALPWVPWTIKEVLGSCADRCVSTDMFFKNLAPCISTLERYWILQVSTNWFTCFAGAAWPARRRWKSAVRSCWVPRRGNKQITFEYFWYILVGGLEHEFYDFPYSRNNMECHHPNWRTHIFQRDWNHQPV